MTPNRLKEVIGDLTPGEWPWVLKAAPVDALLHRLWELGHETRERGVLCEVPGLVLDRAHRFLAVRGVPIALTDREAEVLEVLMRAWPRPASVKHIRRIVWGSTYDDSNVRVYVKYLRRKLPAGLIGTAGTSPLGRGGYLLDLDVLQRPAKKAGRSAA